MVDVSGSFRTDALCSVLGISDSPFLESEVLEVRFEGELRLE